MKQILLLLIFAVLISGGTVGILYQEGIGGFNPGTENNTQEVSQSAFTAEDTEDTEDTEEDDTLDEEEEKDTEEDDKLTDSDSKEKKEKSKKKDSDKDSKKEDESDEDSSENKSDTDTSDIDVPTENDTDISADETQSDDTDLSDTDDSADNDIDVPIPTQDENTDVSPTDSSSSGAALEGKYYTVTIVGVDELMVHGTATDQGDNMGTVPAGAKGYLIEETSEARRLCFIDGKIGYLDKANTQLAEISADQYPKQLLQVTAEDAGKEVQKKSN